MQGAVLVSGDFVRTGGMDMPNFALAEHLADCGVSVQLVAHRVADALLKHARVHWRRVPKPLNSYFLGSFLLDRAGQEEARKSLSRGERVIVNGGNCQVGDVNWVHYVHAAYAAESPLSLARLAKSRVARRLHLAQERSALRSARIIIANSERTRRDLTELVGIDDTRIRTVYYGIDADRFAPVDDAKRRELRLKFGWPDRPQIAFIGAMGDRRKGFDSLFSAWSSLCVSKAWDCDLVVVGRGVELPLWQERATAAGIADRIRFLGFRSDVPDILRACDALIAPTRYEAYGLGVQEALCTGLPALVSADAGVAERYPDQLSELLLRDVTNAAALEASLKSWFKDQDRLRRVTLEFSASLRQRTWRTMAREIHALIDGPCASS